MADAEFKPVRSFDIDNGELDGFSRQQCFVLGYELARIDGILSDGSGRPFQKTVHAANRDRIEAELIRHGREYVFRWPSDDSSESWIYLEVHGSMG